MDFPPYQFDLINSLMKIEEYNGRTKWTLPFQYFEAWGDDCSFQDISKSIGPCLNNFTKFILRVLLKCEISIFDKIEMKKEYCSRKLRNKSK